MALELKLPPRLTPPVIGGIAALVVVVGLVVAWATLGGGPPLTPEEVAGNTELAGELLVRARAIGEGKDAPAADLADRKGPPLWVCGYRPREEPSCARAQADTLAEAVDAAVARIEDAKSVRAWKINVELSRASAEWPKDADERGAGTFGIAVGPAMILPSEVIERRLFEADDDDEDPSWQQSKVRKLLNERGANVPTERKEKFPFERVEMATWVSVDGGAPVRMYRIHPYDDLDPADAAAVLDRAVLGAQHLASLVDEDGKIRYRYRPGPDREGKGQNMLRHAGSTFSLLEAYGRTGYEPWKQAGERALRYMLTQSEADERRGPHGGGTARYLVEGSHIKLGGAGLALVALAEWQEVTGGTQYAGAAKEFATYLVSQQKENGEFVYFASKEPGGEPRDDISDYYPGEAILGLISFYTFDPDPRWLDTARRGADWLIDVRDTGKTPADLDNDHWLMKALEKLHAATKEPKYVQHAERLAAAVAARADKHAKKEIPYADYRGGFGDPPGSTSASTRAEGLVAVITLLDRNKVAHDLRPLLFTLVAQSARSQITMPSTYWMRDPDDALGGFMAGIVEPEMRNDYTQHALSALLGTESVVGKVAGEVDVAARLEAHGH